MSAPTTLPVCCCCCSVALATPASACSPFATKVAQDGVLEGIRVKPCCYAPGLVVLLLLGGLAVPVSASVSPAEGNDPRAAGVAFLGGVLFRATAGRRCSDRLAAR